jgi:Protein of unknown function DUF262/Protein of unknown function (DUF1524)
MDARPLNIVTVLQDPKRFVVPVYQRTYEWTIDKQIEPFFAQVEAKAEQRLTGTGQQLPHYMGALLLMPRGTHAFGTLPVFDVVDGQQRLTTFQIFLSALKDLASSLGQDAIADQIKPYILNTAQALMRNEREERYKLYTTAFDRALFCDLVDRSHADLLALYPQHFYQNGNIRKGEAPKPLRAYCYLREEAEAFVTDATGGDAAAKLGALASALLEDMRVIVITLGAEDDAQVIFETLNSGGEPLAAMDLVRNDVFHRAVRIGEDVERLMEERWRTFEDPFWKLEVSQGRLNKPRIDFFLAHTLAAETGKEILLSELYARYKSFVTDRAFPNVDSELQALIRHAPTYRVLSQPSGDSALAKLARRLQAFEVSTAFPLIFVVANSDAPDSEKSALYELIASYIIRRAICEGLSSKNYNNTFIRVAGQLRSNGVNCASFAAAFADNDKPAVRFPGNAEVTGAILRHRQYGRIPQPRLKWVLSELEFASRTEYDETTGLQANLSIEHVLPDLWTTYWPLPDGNQVQEDKRTGLSPEQLIVVEQRDNAKHTLGNLTLLTPPANTEGLNYAFVRKKDRLRTSLLRINQDIAEEPVWDEAAIHRRAERLAALAVRIWPGPKTM